MPDRNIVAVAGLVVLLVVGRGWDRGLRLFVLVRGLLFWPPLAIRLEFVAWEFCRIF